MPIGCNRYWANYGKGKFEAEAYLKEKVPNCYVFRPAYIYGPMQSLYREPFVFDCALADRSFYIPKDGELRLQFIYIDDLYKITAKLLELIFSGVRFPHRAINVGNDETYSINEFVSMCYDICGKELRKINVYKGIEQRKYFHYGDYSYYVDNKKQKLLLPETKDVYEGLKASYEFYINNRDAVKRINYIEFIENNLK